MRIGIMIGPESRNYAAKGGSGFGTRMLIELARRTAAG